MKKISTHAQALSTATKVTSLFPSELPSESLQVIKDTAAVVAPRALEITSTFYKNVFTKMPELFAFFNRANQGNGNQPKVLADAIIQYASNISDLSPLVVPGGAVDLMAHKHCALNILPAHYPIVHDNLMAAIGEVLGDAVTPDIAKGWSDAVLVLAGILVDKEESLYAAAESRSGGWRGLREFVVSDIQDTMQNVKTFTFTDPNATGLFDFTPGQYLSISVDPNNDKLTAPRHYTITSPPNTSSLQCTIKKIQDGVVSNYMHSNVSIGDVIKLSPPFGCFTPVPLKNSVVLISAGIGATPMVAFARYFGSNVTLLAHIDKKESSIVESAAFNDVFGDENLSSASKILLHSQSGSKHHEHSAAKLVDIIVSQVGTSHSFYVCGPGSFMEETKSSLTERGATHIFSEAFGPWVTGSGCPMKMKEYKLLDTVV